jgi:hypothetical protein
VRNAPVLAELICATVDLDVRALDLAGTDRCLSSPPPTI